MSMTSQLFQIIGLFGPPLFLYAYAMVSLGKWQSTDRRFHMLNFFGAACILLSLLVQWNLAVCILECCWAAISVYGLAKARQVRRASL